MTNTILIPTDFHVESLNTLKFALGEQRDPVKVLFLFGHHLSDSITDLLFYRPSRVIKDYITPQFEEAFNVIGSRYAHVLSEAEYVALNANNGRLLRNLLTYHQPSAIYVPASYKLRPSRRGFDPVPLLKKCGMPVCEVDWNGQASTVDDGLQVLFAAANNPHV